MITEIIAIYLALFVILIVCSCCMFSYLLQTRPSTLQNAQTRSQSTVYSVTMHDRNGTTSNDNSVSEFSRNSRTNHEESGLTTGNRQINETRLMPSFPPCYHYAISATFDRNNEPPPSYYEAVNS